MAQGEGRRELPALVQKGRWDMRYEGLSLDELEREVIAPLPERHTMGVITVGHVPALNGVNVLNGNNIGVVANVLGDNNDSSLKQVTTSNDIITCVTGGGVVKNNCHD